MNEIKNIKRVPFAAYIVFFITSLSFFLQPLLIRPYGIPLSFSLMLILNIILTLNLKDIKIFELIYLFFIGSFLLIIDLYTPAEFFRGFIFINMIYFLYLSSKFSLTTKQSQNLWFSILIVCFTLSLIGLKRWITGYTVEDSQNETGIVENVKAYFYLGISYLSSTRNSDAFYFGIPVILSFSYLRNKFIKYKFLFLGIFLLTSFCVLASLSRGMVVSLLFAYLISSNLLSISKKIFTYLIYLLLTIFLIFVFYDYLKDVPGLGYVLNLTANGILSIFDPNTASINLDGKYTYSNSDRLKIYSESLNLFFEYPFGLGMDNVPPGKFTFGYPQFLHCENAYLDFLVSLGIFSTPCFLFIFKKLKKLYNLNKFHFESKKLYFLLLFILMYSLFCSATDFYYYWFILSLVILELNSYINFKRLN